MGQKIKIVLDHEGYKIDPAGVKLPANDIPITQNFDYSKPAVGMVKSIELINGELIADCDIDIPFEPECYQLNSCSFRVADEMEIDAFDSPVTNPNVYPVINKQFEAKQAQEILNWRLRNEK